MFLTKQKDEQSRHSGRTDPRSTDSQTQTRTAKGELLMNTIQFTLRTLAVVICTLTFISIAQAQASRTWVSGVGDDANPCSRTAPCKTWAGAISKTAAC